MREREVFENALLGFLFEAPGHGYDLSLHFAEGGDLAPIGNLGKSQLYALLKSLEGHGLAEPTLEEGEGGPARRVYRITEKGRARFLSWVTEPTISIRELRVEFLLKLYFLARLGLPGLEELLDAQEGVLRKRRDKLEDEKVQGGLAPWVAGLQQVLIEGGLHWIAEWREKGISPAPAPDSSRAVRRSGGPPASNRLKGTVIATESAGGFVRVDLELQGGRLTTVQFQDDLEGWHLFEGALVEVVIPPAVPLLKSTEGLLSDVPSGGH